MQGRAAVSWFLAEGFKGCGCVALMAVGCSGVVALMTEYRANKAAGGGLAVLELFVIHGFQRFAIGRLMGFVALFTAFGSGYGSRNY